MWPTDSLRRRSYCGFLTEVFLRKMKALFYFGHFTLVSILLIETSMISSPWFHASLIMFQEEFFLQLAHDWKVRQVFLCKSCQFATRTFNNMANTFIPVKLLCYRAFFWSNFSHTDWKISLKTRNTMYTYVIYVYSIYVYTSLTGFF